MSGFVEIFKKLRQKKKEAQAMTGGGSTAGAGADKPKGYSEDLGDDEIREMGRSYIGQAQGRKSVLQQFLQKARKRK